MSLNFKKSYKFAFKSALYVTLFTAGFSTLLGHFLFFEDPTELLRFVALLTVSVFLFAFFMIQYRVEVFIYRRVKKIYDDVSFLDASSLRRQPITTDMATLTSEVRRFATEKKIEIETLKEREEYRREFLGNVSHELKTPLFTVQGYLSTLLDGAMSDKSVRRKYLERAEKGVERLIYIVQDLDMITRLETGTVSLSISEFNIVEVVQNVFDLLEMKAEQKNIILTFDNKYIRPLRVVGDREKIQQVVTNLVVNAIKYGRRDGSVEVGFEDLAENKLIVRVTDDGEGIAKKHIPRLFERFFRVDKSGGREEGGSGLGLSIVKHILEAHDEAVFVESTPGRGSEFSFTLEKAK